MSATSQPSCGIFDGFWVSGFFCFLSIHFKKQAKAGKRTKVQPSKRVRKRDQPVFTVGNTQFEAVKWE